MCFLVFCFFFDTYRIVNDYLPKEFYVKFHTASRNLSQDVPPELKTAPPPPLFYILTLFLSLYSSVTLPSKSKSCVTIATAAVCKNYLNPSLFLTVFPVTFNGYCFDAETHNQVEGVGNKRERGWCSGNSRVEQQSRKRRGGIRGGKACWPDSQPANNDRGHTQENSQTDDHADTLKHKTNKQKVNKETEAKGAQRASGKQTDRLTWWDRAACETGSRQRGDRHVSPW